MSSVSCASPALSHVRERLADLVFIGLLVLCLCLAVGAIRSGIEKREALVAPASGRKVDVAKVRKQISDGLLSPRKALFFRKVPK